MGKRLTPAEEAALLRGATREAHEAMKGLRETMREADALIKKIGDAAEVSVDRRVQPIIKKFIDEWAVACRKAIAESEDRINGRFDRVADILLGEDRASLRKHGKSFTDLAVAVRDGEMVVNDGPPVPRLAGLATAALGDVLDMEEGR